MKKEPAQKTTVSKATVAKEKVAPAPVKGKFIELQKIDTSKVAEIQGLEKESLEIVKANPFVKVDSNKSYEEAKKARLALLSRSTTIEKQDKSIASFLSNFRKNLGNLLVGEKGINKITRIPYEKQNKEIEEWENKVEAEKERKAKELEEKENAIKENIKKIEGELNAIIDATTFETIEPQSTSLETKISEHSGTFEKFDVLFDNVDEAARNRMEERIAFLTSENDKLEENRKEAHRKAMTNIKADAGSLVLEMKFETIPETEEKFAALLDTERDFQEFKEEFETLKASWLKIFQDQKTKLIQKDEADREQKEKDEELVVLRKMKLYNERSKILKEAGIEMDEQGNFFAFGIVYAVNFIETDSEAVFEEILNSIKEHVKIKTAPPTAPVLSEQFAEPSEEAPAESEAPAEESSEEVAEIAPVVPSVKRFENIKTVGEVRAMLEGLEDSAPFVYNGEKETVFVVELINDQPTSILFYQR